jgi:hypothetical protein
MNIDPTIPGPAASVTESPGQTSLQGNDQPPLAQPSSEVEQTSLEDRKCENWYKLLDASISIAKFFIGYLTPEKGFWFIFPLVCVFSFYIAFNKSREEAPPAVIGNYLAENGITTNTFLTEQQIRDLPFPPLKFAQEKLVVNGKTAAEMEASGQDTSNNLARVLTQTNVRLQDHGRTIVNMSGEENLCGYRAILSQIDPNCAGMKLAHYFQGGIKLESMSTEISEEDRKLLLETFKKETLAKVNELRLAIAVGCAKDHPRDVRAAGGLRRYLESKMKALTNPNGTDAVDSAGGMLGAEDLRYMSAALNKPIVIIEGNTNSLNMMKANLSNLEGLIAKMSEGSKCMGRQTIAEMERQVKEIDDKIARLGKSNAPSALKARSDLEVQRAALSTFIQRDAIRNSITELERGGATLRIYGADGDYFTCNTLLADDSEATPSDANNPEAIERLTVQQKRYIFEQLLDSDTIVLYNENDHYMAVQKSSQTL